jgi:CBS domain-containing protein/rhodanese-related sulfurtransferase
MRNPDRLKPEELRQKLDAGASTLLVCAYDEEDKARAFRLDGAITLQELEHKKETFGQDQELVFYCACPADELSIAKAIEWNEAGYPNAKFLAGGVEAWKAAGYELAQPAPYLNESETAEPATTGPKATVASGREALPPRGKEGPDENGSGWVADQGEGHGPRQAVAAGGGGKKACDVMTRDPQGIALGECVKDAARKMRDLDVGSLPVCDEQGRFVGMITDRDITCRVTAEGKDPSSTKVDEAMSKDLIFCAEDADLSEVARVMQEKQIRRIPIVKAGEAEADTPREIVGIISLGDLATDLQASAIPAETLAEVSEDRT